MKSTTKRKTATGGQNARSDSKTLVKVAIDLDESDWHDVGTESMWAEPLGKDKYHLDNSPFYAYGLSWHDVVIAKPVQSRLVFQGIAERGGHSTYRIILNKGVTLRSRKFKQWWNALQELGCTYEEMDGHLLTVDVPPQANIYKVYETLEQGVEAGVWDFEEAHCGHKVD